MLLSEGLLIPEALLALMRATEHGWSAERAATAETGAVPAGSKRRRRADRGSAHRFLGAVLGVALLGAAAVVAVATVPALLGYRTFIVYGGSMGSGLEIGSVAVTRPTNPEQLQVGDIVARSAGSPHGMPILHRVVGVGVDGGEPSLTTKGDANTSADPEPLTLGDDTDRLVYSVPYAGYLLHYTGSELGRVLLIGVPALLLVVPPLAKPRRSRRDRPERKASDRAVAASSEGAVA